ncbi:GAF domain-containing protein [Sphingobium xenophagum]|uniref:GAF domain-containing protein n=1 Tax=Sphingobium xenophagum TaxID=121428 RepID=UPI00036FD198|nr:GAF domain-containing protein [Sphingobium xenophagum]
MRDDFAASVAAHGDDDRIRAILEQVCQTTGMGFAAVARVTEDRWVACQIVDRIEFGLDPGGELEIKKTLCDDIRRCGEGIYIDHVAMDQDWRTHHVPLFYGFQSYVSLPVILLDGSFYGTLCAIDPNPRSVSAPAIVAAMQDYARSIGAILSAK